MSNFSKLNVTASKVLGLNVIVEVLWIVNSPMPDTVCPAIVAVTPLPCTEYAYRPLGKDALVDVFVTGDPAESDIGSL